MSMLLPVNINRNTLPAPLTQLRLRWLAIVIIELCNQPFSYILPRDQYGKGLYQDECAVLGPGSLESIADAIAGQLTAWGLE